MQLSNTDILIHAFTPDDGSESAAVKVSHKTMREEVVNNETISPRHNLRLALFQLVEKMNPNPANIPNPRLVPFDHVQVNLPQSVHEGEVTRLSWDFPRREWRYFVECPNRAVSTWYVLADLDQVDED